MVNFAPHLRITAIGTIGSTEETFSYGLSMAYDGPVGITWNEFGAISANGWTDLCDSVRDFHTRSESMIHNECRLKMVKVAMIKANGSYENPGAMIFREYDAPGTGGGIGYILPQSALAVTLDTDRPGPSGRGRFYIPMPVVGPQNASMLISDANAVTVRDSVATMLNDINNFPGVDIAQNSLHIVVASSKGYNSGVNGVRVGRVVDTMRSRRRAIPETYTASVGIS